MARRKRQSAFEVWVDLAARLPWWVCALLAVLSYVVLSRIAATPPQVTAYQPGKIGATLWPGIWFGLANLGQFVLPAIFGISAVVSAWRRAERRNLVADVAHAAHAEPFDGMSWQEFEQLVGEGFRLQGYSVEEVGSGGADGGVDLVLRRAGEKFLVQCKQWRAYRVGVDVVRQLYGVMAARGAAGGFVVTSGRFTEDAKTFAEGRNIELMDGERLHALVRAVQRRSGAAPAAKPPPVQTQTQMVPSYPMCDKPMMLRTARRGNSAGSSFWGCTGYPACRGTRAAALPRTP
jgi:restriction system protein